ncbi:hypothetical protein [Flagellimonas onchidii]|uniref:hypothetical protein n=1 Tax=Flagellimonas onchidii TaxID=2562684 RepID=UPI0010A65506|nr:hypothetical protein [Allomuricauda onchidii]
MKEIKDLTKVLLSNLDEIKENSVNGKMFVANYLFNYREFQKDSTYEDELLEVIEIALDAEFSNIQNARLDFFTGITGLGWALVKLVRNGFFESSNLMDILNLVDSKVTAETEVLCKSTIIERHDLLKLLGAISYFIERIGLSNAKTPCDLRISQYLSMAIHEVSGNLRNNDIEDFWVLQLRNLVIKECLDEGVLEHLGYEKIRLLKESLVQFDKKQISEYYFYFLENKQFLLALTVRVLLEEGHYKEIEEDKLFFDQIENYARNIMIQMKDAQNVAQENLYELCLIACASLKNMGQDDNEFLRYALGFRLCEPLFSEIRDN